METGRVGFVNRHWLGAWADVYVRDSSAHTAYLSWGSLWTQTFCCSVTNGQIQLNHAPAATKRSDMNKIMRCRDSRTEKSRETMQGWEHRTIKHISV